MKCAVKYWEMWKKVRYTPKKLVMMGLKILRIWPLTHILVRY